MYTKNIVFSVYMVFFRVGSGLLEPDPGKLIPDLGTYQYQPTNTLGTVPRTGIYLV